MTPTWVTILVAVVGVIGGGAVGAFISTRHEHRSWLRAKILEAGSEFSSTVLACFGPVRVSIDRVFEQAEPDDVPELEDDGGDSDDDPDEVEARDYWSAETIEVFEAARIALLRAEAALAPLLLLLPEESVPVQAGNRALDRIGRGLGSLEELPRDAKVFSDIYALSAQLEWKAFNSSVQKELRRAGKRIPRRLREHELAKHQTWVEEELAQKTEGVEARLRNLE
jgi:hypothetical protein